MKEIPFEAKNWPAVEGSIDMIFGGLGSGKTYAATADILSDLQAGYLVYATWPIDFKGLDERSSWFSLILAFFGIKWYFYQYDKNNFRYIPLSTPNFMEIFASSTDCVWYVDEAYAVIDSYVKNKMSLEQRFSIYGTRHFNRRLVLVAQRPSSIHVAARAMVNRFYKCERPLASIQRLLHIAVFVKTEYQEMIDENVDLEQPLSTKMYFGRRRIFRAYDSKYLRNGAVPLHTPKIVLYKTNPYTLVLYLLLRFRAASALKRAQQHAKASLAPQGSKVTKPGVTAPKT